MVDKTPFTIGSGPDCDWRIDDYSVAEEHCVIERKGRAFHLLAANGSVLLDGLADAGGELASDTDHTLSIDGHLFALHESGNAREWLGRMNHSEWFIFKKSESQKYGPIDFPVLAEELERFPAPLDDVVVLCRGLTTMGFYAEQILPWLPRSTPALSDGPREEEPTEIDIEYGEFTCPVCWLKFDRGDAMNIAVHASLRGDPILGEEHLQRFHATRFTDRGQALDAMNIPAPDLACPHCRRKLPQGFLDMPHLIFSIVGAPSSGKSYYLSVLVKVLQSALFKNFGITFRDADPSANVILNQMKTQLFSAATPEDAYLAKTELEGAMYETLPRLGRKVPLPKPFIFNLSNPRDQGDDFSVVFYDNAGEHFEPTRNSADSPGAQHIAAASGIFFLFDPLHNEEFKKRLTGLRDPQVDSRRLDQQDIILAETEVRIKSLLGLDARQKIATPFAVIVGKSDTWLHLLGGEPIESPVRDGRLDHSIVARNSARVRALLIEICPAIAANAEAVSSDVMYFAASPLGCSPVEFTDARGVTLIGPDPQRLNPQHVEIPTFWVLSRVAPGVVPSAETD
ncbi:MAG: hypothetical protein JWL59_3358 [Chthoniobacteraceae bacterium]|nr:hypothetical protein [Chthoniobacteraceae bacterium]